jgi:hypothetical protein
MKDAIMARKLACLTGYISETGVLVSGYQNDSRDSQCFSLLPLPLQ